MKESLVAKALRGFFILLPFLIAYLMAGQLVDMLLGLTQPIIDVMPGILIRSEGMQRLFAFVVLILICILVAQIAHTALARRFGRWFEDTVMGKFPPYEILKSLSQRLSGADEDRLQPALMTVAPDARILVAIVEELRDGNVTVFAPMAPAPGLGTLQIVSSSKLERLECSMADALSWPMNWVWARRPCSPRRMTRPKWRPRKGEPEHVCSTQPGPRAGGDTAGARQLGRNGWCGSPVGYKENVDQEDVEIFVPRRRMI